MSLASLIRGRRAHGIPLDEKNPGRVFADSLTGASEKSSRPETVSPARAWLLHFPDRNPLEVWTAPLCTHAEALALYPDAVAAEPIQHNLGKRTASTSERSELPALVEAIYADDTDEDRQEAIGLALADPDGALACYRATAAERGIVLGKPVRIEARTETARVQACRSCQHRAAPGRTERGYCAERTDQSKAYGDGHPLHQLPADGGNDCPKWAPY